MMGIVSKWEFSVKSDITKCFLISELHLLKVSDLEEKD